MKDRIRLTGLKKLLPRAHLEAMRGTAHEAAEYCKKEGDYYEEGTLPLNGGETAKRNYDLIIATCKQGKFDDLDSQFFFNHYHTCKRIRQDYPVYVADAEDVTGYWYHGPPRTGKSRFARQENPVFYDKPCNKWWDGYDGQEVVIIDDFDRKELGHHLKRWTDRYSFPAEQKGTTIQIRPKRIVITSNYTPEQIWPEDPMLVAAIRARCKFVLFPNDTAIWDEPVIRNFPIFNPGPVFTYENSTILESLELDMF